MPTTFHVPENRARSVVAVARSAATPTLVLADASSFGTVFPKIVTIARNGVVVSILEATARSGNSLTISGAIEATTDVNLLVGDIVELRPTKLAMTEIHDAVHTLETAAGSGDIRYVFTQASPAAVWTINHGLGKYPSVTIIDSADSIVIGYIRYIDTNSIEVSFAGGFSGKAYLN